MIKTSTKSGLVSYAIRDIVTEAKELEKKGKEMLYLNIGDPSPFGFRPPEHITDAVKNALSENYSGYAPSEGDPELREAVAEYEKVPKENVFITSGLSEGIDFLYSVMVDPGRNILIPNPAYPLYVTKQKISYGPLDFYECDENFEPDIDSLRKNITDFTRAILVINPNNPTGAVYSRKTLEKIVDVAGEYNLPIISDDAYEHILLDGEYVNLRDIHKDVPLVSGNSMSKNFLYPGARAAYIAFHGDEWKEVREAVQRMCNQRLSVNWEMQKGYLSALRGPMDHISGFISEMRKRRDLVMKRINEIDGLSTAVTRGAFYSFVKVEKGKWKNDWEFARELLRHGVVVVPGSAFGPKKDIYFRMVILPEPEKIENAFDSIEQMISGSGQA